MSKHNSHGGSLHWIPYISPNKDEKDFSRCSYYIDGFCIRDNQPCMESNYCKELDYFSPLAQQFLKRPKVGSGFIYGDVKYTIKNFEIKKVNKISNS